MEGTSRGEDVHIVNWLKITPPPPSYTYYGE